MDLFTPTAYIGMLNGNVHLNTTTTTPIYIGTDNMKGRKWLWIMNASNVKIFIGSAVALDGVAISQNQLAKRGIKIASGDAIWLPVADNITVYGISQSGAGKRLRVMELG